MNTYHIKPSYHLAKQAAEVARTFDPDTLIAIRGQDFEYGDGETEDTVYTVSACPNQGDTSGYCWTYVRAGDWLEEFDRLNQT